MAERKAAPWDRLEGSQARVVDALRRHGALSRSALGSVTGLSRATIAGVVADLRADGLLVEREDSRPKGDGPSVMGRPASLVALDQRAGVAVGIDLGKRRLQVAVADLSHDVLAERGIEVPADAPAPERIDRAAELLDAVLREAGVDRDSVVGVGAAIPAPVRPGTGELRSATILPGWVGFPARDALEERLGLPVAIGNDTNLGALAEATWGVARGVDDVVYVKWAVDIGCGLLLGGKLHAGAGGIAGEIGHSRTEASSVFCRCGNRGCLETAAGTQWLADAVSNTIGAVTPEELVERAMAGDAVCLRALAEGAAAVGGTLAQVVNLVNPQLVVLGGQVARVGTPVLTVLERVIRDTALRPASDDVEIRTSALGDRAEVLGAIALILRESGLGIEPRAGEALVG